MIGREATAVARDIKGCGSRSVPRRLIGSTSREPSLALVSAIDSARVNLTDTGNFTPSTVCRGPLLAESGPLNSLLAYEEN